MKSFGAILVIAFCFYVQIEARTLEKRNPGDIVDLTIFSGVLHEFSNASATIYCINTPTILPLPINKDTIKNLTYVEYITPPCARTDKPIWNKFMNFPASSFSLNSYLVIELWNHTSNAAFEYLGGIMFTIERLEQFAPQSYLALFDLKQTHIGNVLLGWSNK